MEKTTLNAVKKVIIDSIGRDGVNLDLLTEDYQLIGNILDSMAVNTLILGLEEHFGFLFEDEDLSAEAFETVSSLTKLVEKKLRDIEPQTREGAEVELG